VIPEPGDRRWLLRKAAALEKAGGNVSSKVDSSGISLPEHEFVSEADWDLLERGRFPLKERSRFAVKQPDSADAWAFYGEADIWVGDYEGAIEHANKALTLDPSSSKAWRQKAFATAALGDIVGAKNLLSEVPDQLRDDPRLLEAAAGLLVLEGNLGEAKELVQRAVLEVPDCVGHWTALFYVLMMSESDEADKVAGEIRSRFGDHFECHLAEARRLIHKLDLSAAEKEARFAVASGPESASAWVCLAQTLIYQGKISEGENAARQALEINPRRGDAWTSLAHVAKERGDLVEAQRCKERSEESQPYFKFQSVLSDALEALGYRKFGEARMLAQKVLEEPSALPLHSTALGALLTCAEEQKRFDEVERLLEQFAQHHGKKLEWYEHAVRLSLHKSDRRNAISILEEGLNKFPHSGSLIASRLKVLKELEDPRLDECIRGAVEAALQRSDLGVRVAIALDDIGRKEQSRELLSSLKTKFPEDQAVELMDAASTLDENPIKSLSRMRRIKRPEFARVWWLNTAVFILLLGVMIVGAVLYLPFALVRKVLRLLFKASRGSETSSQ